MKIRNLSDQLIYVPNRKSGESEFKGSPKPSQEVVELIAQDGVEHIANELNEIVKMRIMLLGDGRIEFYGMYPIQRFFDLKNRIAIRIQEIANENEPKRLTIIDKPNPRDYSLTLEPVEKYILRKGSNIGAFRCVKWGYYSSFKFDKPF